MREAYASVLALEPGLDLAGVVATAEEALDALTGPAARPCDLVVTDFRLPGRSGVDLVRDLGAARPGLPVVVVTAHDGEAFEREARQAGAADFLNKRDLVFTLGPTIRAALGATAH